MTDMEEQLPDELQKEMTGNVNEEQRYTTHDYVLSYVGSKDGSKSNDMLAYLYAVSGKVTTRGYLYHVIIRLRKRGLITTKNRQVPGKATHFITFAGMKKARPFCEVPNAE